MIKRYNKFIKESINLEDKISILKELSLDLTDNGLYVSISTEDPRLENLKGNVLFVKIEDRDKVFCKNYPEDDMDWLVGKQIIQNYINDLKEDFGLVYRIDYYLFGGGPSATLAFNEEGYEKIHL